jgi:hypothetical protein
MNDKLIKLLSSFMGNAKQSSTRTSIGEQSISDLMTPDSIRYASPENVRAGRTSQPGIPIDMVELSKAIDKLLSSEGGEFAKSIGGDILKYRYGFNQKREGQSILDEMLEKLGKMNAPGGLVAHRTEMGFPSYFNGKMNLIKEPKSKELSANISRRLGHFITGSSEEVPDTIALFGDKFGDRKYSGLPGASERAKDRMVSTLLHELIHGGDTTKKGDEIRQGSKAHQLSRLGHLEDFEKVTEKIAQDPSIKDILFNAIMGKSYGKSFLQSITKGK